MLMAVASMLGVAMGLSGVAQAKPTTNGKAGVQCMTLAIQTLGPGFNPNNYNFIGGTAGNDNLTGQATEGSDVFCGFGGDDRIAGIYTPLAAGDIFLGGAGNDYVTTNYGTFYGGAGDDSVGYNLGTFNGGDGNDYVYDNEGRNATFNGGDGIDSVTSINTGTTDSVENLPGV